LTLKTNSQFYFDTAIIQFHFDMSVSNSC